MCPFRYLYHVLLFIASNALITSCAEWKASFEPSAVTIKTATKQRVRLILSDLTDEAIANINDRDYLQLRSENDELATVRDQSQIKFFEVERSNRSWDANFDLHGVFLGELSTRKPQVSRFVDICSSPPSQVERKFSSKSKQKQT